MRIIPVLDLKGGAAVHAVAGDRSNYKPLAKGGSPREVAADFRTRLDLRELYLADLDAIAGAPPRLDLYDAIRADGSLLWIDAGTGSAETLALRADFVIVGLESIETRKDLETIAATIDPARLAFSLDLREGSPIRKAGSHWILDDPAAYVETALDLGVRRVILLDLARVGTGRGLGTESLLKRLAGDGREVEWIVGGGLRSIDDVRDAGRLGASAALVGTALHDGRIGRFEIESLEHQSA